MFMWQLGVSVSGSVPINGNPAYRKSIVTCLKTKDNICLKTPVCSKTRRTQLLSRFPFLGSGTLRKVEP